MKYRAILFDMDGTLLPMDTDAFTKGYFRSLYAKIAGYGLDPKQFAGLMWEGVAAMVRNDGTRTNEAVLWDVFSSKSGISQDSGVMADCNAYYGEEFHTARVFTGENPLAAEAVRLARSKAEKVVLATNPLFPMVGQVTRMSWVGLSPVDFDLVTSYESDCFCKPNPAYFRTVCERIGVEPSECLMIGNDEGEDMHACTLAGMDGYLVTDCLISDEKHPWSGPCGTFADLVEMLKSMA